jgi:uncharacterized membrane protein YfcA
MHIGQRIRRRVPEDRFRTLLYVALLLLGVHIAAQNLLR